MSVSACIRDGVAHLRLARPAKRNALNQAMVDAALVAIDGFLEQGATVGVLGAEGPVFCSGSDTGEVGEAGEPAADRLADALVARPIFWVAAIEGPVLGAGIGLVAACPLAIATRDSWFACPERALGLFPSVVFGQLQALIGARRAFELALSGKGVGADDAVEWGLITEAVAPDRMTKRLSDWTRELLAQPRVTAAARSAWAGRLGTSAYVEYRQRMNEHLGAQYVREAANG
jgi:enoyl-CoA hydratase/carnithine racemase